jgi:uncharacterized protein with HEPN domain
MHDLIHSLIAGIMAVQEYTAEKTVEDILTNADFKDEVLARLEKVGEIAHAIPEDVREVFPEVNFEDAAFLKDIVMHDFFGIDYESLWGIITGGLIVLSDELRSRLQMLSGE